MNDTTRLEAENGIVTYIPPSWIGYNPTKQKKSGFSHHRLAPEDEPATIEPSKCTPTVIASSSSSSSAKPTLTLVEKFSAFLVDTQLLQREDTLRAAGYAEVADLEAATDDELAELGKLKKPEIIRLRRYLVSMK